MKIRNIVAALTIGLASSMAMLTLLRTKLTGATISMSVKGQIGGGLNDAFARYAKLDLVAWDDGNGGRRVVELPDGEEDSERRHARDADCTKGAIPEERDSTVLSVVMDLGAMTMRLADGRPCETGYRTLDYSDFFTPRES